MIKRSMGEVDMPGFQTKVLVVMSISGDNFRIILPNCMFGWACVLQQSWIFFFAKEDHFLMLFQMCTKLMLGLSNILMITVIAQNRINSIGSLFLCDRILRFGRSLNQSSIKPCLIIFLSFIFAKCYQLTALG